MLYCLTDIRSPCEFTVASVPFAGPRITALSSRGRESLSLGINTPDLNRRPTVSVTIALPIELVLVD